MSDLTLNINGNASGASAAFREAGGAVEGLGNDVGKSVVKWQELAAITKKAVELVVKFGIDAVKAYAESERVQKQLTRAAGEYADVLGEQAEALSKKYAVDDDIIKQSQVLLTQWGGVGAATEDVTKAVLNYAAATGQDAVAATSDLIRNVESGGVGLAKMGVHFTATGQKGKDLAAAVGALNKKFGGAAAADADSLVGQTHAAELAFEDFRKTVGGAIAEMVRATGIVPKLTQGIRELTDSLFTPTAKKQAESQEYIAQQVKYWEDITAGNVVGYKDFATQTQFTFEEAQANLAQWRAKLRPDDFNITPSVAPGVAGLTNKGRKDAAAAAPGVTDDERLAAAKKFYADLDSIEAHAAEQEAKLLADREKQRSAFVTGLEKQSGEAWEAIEKQEQAATELAAKQDEALMKALDQSVKDSMQRAQAHAQQAKQAADAIGAAFVNALGEQLSKLAEGGELDVAIFVGDLLAAAVSTAATVIGSAYGMGALGAAVGNIASISIRAGAKSVSASTRPRKYHEGGWVGDEAELPRYHSGGWINPNEQVALLRRGERVATPEEVQNAGGRAALDAALSGRSTRPSVVVNLQAIDSKSAAESFVTDLGDGLRRALRSGHGAAPALIGVPR